MSESDPTLSVHHPRRGPGRPRHDEPKFAVTTWIPQRDHERLMRIARECDCSVSAVIRQVLRTTPDPT